MAIWQFEVRLEPQQQVTPPGGGGGGVPCEQVLKLACSGEEVVRWLDARFPQLPSWSESVVTWGEESGHRVQAIWEDSKLVDLTARVDLRQSCVEFLRQILLLAEMCNAVWVTVDGERLQPTLIGLREAILASPSYRFVSDPHQFLSEVGEGN